MKTVDASLEKEAVFQETENILEAIRDKVDINCYCCCYSCCKAVVEEPLCRVKSSVVVIMIKN